MALIKQTKNKTENMFIHTASTTRATDSKIFGDTHSTKPYNAHKTAFRRSSFTFFTREYNSVNI